MKKAAIRKAAARAAPKPALKAGKAKPKNAPAARPVARRGRAGKSAALWPAVNAGLAAAGDAAAAGASLLALLVPKGNAGAVQQHVAAAWGAQFARASAALRKRAALGLSAQSIDAARELLNLLKVYAEAAAVMHARGAEIAEVVGALERARQRRFQSDLGRLALLATRGSQPADVPALMTAALERVLREAQERAK